MKPMAWLRWLPIAAAAARGSQRVLSAEQEARIQHVICDDRPEQFKMDFALWSRATVMQRTERT